MYILRDIQAAVDPSNATVLAASWGATDAQPCAPWPSQSATTPGLGQSWTGVTCLEWSGAASTVANPAGGGVGVLSLDALQLAGTLPVQLRELRTMTTFSAVRNNISGTIPNCWGANITWGAQQQGAVTLGFNSLTLIDLSQNKLSGALPSLLPLVTSLTLSVIDNQLTGSVPASYSSLAGLAIAFNPLLFGTLPAGLTAAKMLAYSTNSKNYFPANSNSGSAMGGYGDAPTYGTGVLYGTSIGLLRPLVYILRDLQAALDPQNTSALRTSWGASHLQPCMPWTGAASGTVTWLAQSTAVATRGRSWTGVACDDKYLGLPFNGAILRLLLPSLGLNGTLPCALAELQTVNTVSFNNNSRASLRYGYLVVWLAVACSLSHAPFISFPQSQARCHTT